MARETVLVTGASSGIGFSTARELARRGHPAIAAMREPAGKNAEVAAELHAAGCEIADIDVTSDASVSRGVSDALARTGQIDVLVNCAGIMWLGVSESFGLGQFDSVMQTNLYGPFRMMKSVLPQMRARGSGLIIAVSSIAGRIVTPGAGLYSASKFALEALTEAMRYETAALGIDCIIVEPGPFRTQLKANGVPGEEAAVAAGYGPLAELQKLTPERMAAKLQAPGVTTDPKAVADLICDLIEMPAGKRPLRSTVGLDFGVAELNRAVAPIQHSYLAAMGLEGCENVSTGRR
jgi:NAD(P)-dependent dehydrogenase (short-subunit alcohol dehydrogenase family)